MHGAQNTFETPHHMTDLRADAPTHVPFLFQHSQKRVGGSLGVSLLIHGVVIALVIFIANRSSVQQAATSLFPDALNKDIVWLDIPGPGGGRRRWKSIRRTAAKSRARRERQADRPRGETTGDGDEEG